jgi:deoxyribose-phosphate aldolase
MWIKPEFLVQKNFNDQQIEIEMLYRACIIKGEHLKILLEDKDLREDHSEPSEL